MKSMEIQGILVMIICTLLGILFIYTYLTMGENVVIESPLAVFAVIMGEGLGFFCFIAGRTIEN